MTLTCRGVPAGRSLTLPLFVALLAGAGATVLQAQAPTRAGAGAESALRAGAQQAMAPAAATTPGRALPACERCHGELEFLRQRTGSLERAQALSVSARSLEGSGHDLPCAKCHSGFDAFPHVNARVATAPCASCHPQVAAAWRAGAHARVDRGNPVECQECHGIHVVPRRAELRSRAAVALLNGRCLGCHDTRKFAARAPHADGVSCAACHGAHDVRGHDRAGSTLTAEAQLRTCGGCHRAIAQSWSRDSHGRLLLAGGERKPRGEKEAHPGPACTTCHGGHDMLRPRAAPAGTGPAAACTTCHERYADTFADSYHGQASKLGSRRVAGCAGCHTAHAVLPADSPRSSVAQANVVRTCASCHPRANARFAAFQPHADVHDRAKSPLLYFTYHFMTLLLTGTMMLFGLHGALWLVRLGLARAAARRTPAGTHGGEA